MSTTTRSTQPRLIDEVRGFLWQTCLFIGKLTYLAFISLPFLFLWWWFALVFDSLGITFVNYV